MMTRAKILAPVLFALMLVGCNSGGSEMTINANVTGGTLGTTTTGTSCSNMVTGSTCVMTLNLNNNGTPQLNLTFSTLPPAFTNNPTFVSGVNQCESQLNDSNNVPITCNITLTYVNATPSTPNSQTANLTFYLSNSSNPNAATSNIITLSGD